MFSFTQAPPLSLYIHLPWCIKKCPYCDFNSHVSHNILPEQDYLNALISDLELDLPKVWGRTVSSIFIGGGTPSLFKPESIETLLSHLRARLNLLPGCEISLEANPGSVEQSKFNEFRAAGINRISIGIQSFQPALLQRIGRIHDDREALSAVECAQNAGFESINLDLMFGLPGQTLVEAAADIETALSFKPQHLSHYQLTLEPETAFYKKPPLLPIDEDISYMQTYCQTLVADNGYCHYEISAYAKEGNQCHHNLNYWQFGDYMGIGAGAHGKITDVKHNTITRTSKCKQPQLYIEQCKSGTQIDNTYELTRADAILEFMMNTLRLNDGFHPQMMQNHAGIPLASVKSILETAQQDNLLTWNKDLVITTSKGRRYLNELLERFLPSP